MFAACTATILSSPWNYVRNVHYATPPGIPAASFYSIITDLFLLSRKEATLYKRSAFILKRFRIGWGTARVGVGMAFGSELYYYCSQSFQNDHGR